MKIYVEADVNFGAAHRITVMVAYTAGIGEMSSQPHEDAQVIFAAGGLSAMSISAMRRH